MPHFFEKHRSLLSLKQEDSAHPGFRICQLGAIWAAKSHFTASEERALINLPTGAGKTAVMMALAFELGARRVFILTPSVVLREQTVNEFRSLRQLTDHITSVPKSFKDRPKVEEIKNELHTDKDWKRLLEFDVVVATPAVLQSKAPIAVFGSSTNQAGFDLVFVDEAHHSPAETWSQFLNQIQRARIVLFSATPFRRDRKRIRAKLIYVYPISKAISDGVYRPVEFVGVHEPDVQRRDAQLAEECRSRFVKERRKDPSTSVIIKAKTIKHAGELSRVYKEAGFKRLGVIHSDRSADENRDVLAKVARNLGDEDDDQQLSGFICVDIGSEGIDVPTLRIAVFHDVPRTLPYTVQIIGRVTRINRAHKGQAFLIADPGPARGTEVQELYYSDEGWAELVPKLFEDYINTSKFLPMPGSMLAGLGSLAVDDLTPYFTVRIYEKRRRATKSFSIMDASLDEISLANHDVDVEVFDKRNGLLTIITRTWEVPRWTAHRAFETQRFDLHVYCQVDSLVFEFTTSERIGRLIRDELRLETLFQPAGFRIIRNGLSDASDGHYFMVGMTKQSGSGSQTPQYKILMGDDVQNAVKFADGRSFTAGHAMMKKEDGITRGIALQSSRIWSNTRKSLVDFEQWCKDLTSLMRTPSPGIPKIDDKLMEAKPITSYPRSDPPDSKLLEVISILFDTASWNANRVEVRVNAEKFPEPICSFSDWDFDPTETHIFVELQVMDQTKARRRATIKLEHHLVAPYWRVISPTDVLVDIDSGIQERQFAVPLAEYLRYFPPLMVLSSGSTVRGNVLFKPKIQTQRLGTGVIEVKNWDDTDITKEADPPRKEFLWNVQQKTERIIFAEFYLGKDDFLVCDDRANEIADYVLIQGGLRKEITFFHCKYKSLKKDKSSGKNESDGNGDSEARSPKPGVSRENITELLDQGVRTGYWIGAENLVDRLLSRIAGMSRLVHPDGDVRALEAFGQTFYPSQWTYSVVLVQPGLSSLKLKSSAKPSQAEQLLIVLWDRITTEYGAKFFVWAND